MSTHILIGFHLSTYFILQLYLIKWESSIENYNMKYEVEL